MISPRFHRFDVVGSTNDIALDMARSGEDEGVVVTAQQQLAGRGRRGRTWCDQPGKNVLMSLLVTPDKPASDLCQLAFVAGLAVVDCLDKHCGIGNASIKWPNDVLVRSRKIAGILVETSRYEGRQFGVVGIGLNVNQSEFPSQMTNAATSVVLENGDCMGVDDLSERLATLFFCVYEDYLRKGFEDILARWQKYMWGVGEHTAIAQGDNELRGTIRGVHADGALLIEDAQGTVHAVWATS